MMGFTGAKLCCCFRMIFLERVARGEPLAATAAGLSVEILHADARAELRAFRLATRLEVR